MPEAAIVTVAGLSVSFPADDGPTRHDVVKDVSLQTHSGKTLGLVGESGSGKTMTALSIMGLVPAPGLVSGSIRFQDQKLIGSSETEYEKFRGSAIAMVFQDPATALNPVMRLEEQLVETLLQHQPINRRQARELALQSLQQVEIAQPEQRIRDYPHTLSGGMKQRVLLAMALSCHPKFVILDEPTTALDVTVQSQILDLVERIQAINQMSVLLISHDLGIIAEISDDVAIMYAGKIVESGSCESILKRPLHPYTQSLLDAIPKIGHLKQPLNVPKTADVVFNPDLGCPFAPRCPQVMPDCQEQSPTLSDAKHAAACWRAGER